MSAPEGDPAVSSSRADAVTGGDGGTDQSADPELTFAMFAGASAAAAAAPPLQLPSLVGQTAASHGGDLQHEIDAVFSGGQTYDHLSANADAASIGGYSPALPPRSLRPSSRQASAAEIDLLLMQSRHALPASKHASRSRGSSRQSEVCVRGDYPDFMHVGTHLL